MIGHTASTLAPIVSWILFASCKSVFVIALVLLCQRLLRRWLSPQGRYVLWFAVIACLTVPVGAKLDMNLFSTSTSSANKSILNHTTQAEANASGSFTSSISDPQQADTADLTYISIRSWLTLLWLMLVLGLMIVVLRNFIRYQAIKSDSEDVDYTTRQLFEQCRSELNVSRVCVLETDQIESPALFGGWSSTLLLPRGLAKRLTENQLRLVFLHELCHAQRHDILVNWLLTCVQIVHWFNPAVWYALRTMRTDMEQACDAKVMGHLSAREQIDYGDTLIRLSDLNQQWTLLPQGAGIVDSHAQLKARIGMIAAFKPHRAGHSLFAAALLMGVTSVAVTQPTSDAQTASTPGAASDQTLAQKETEPEKETESSERMGASAKQIQLEVHIVLASPGFSRDLLEKTTTPKAPSDIATIDSNYDVRAELESAQSDGRLEIVASPRMIAVNRKQAIIRIVRETPYPALVGQVSSKFSRFKFSELTLKLTPRISPDPNNALDLQLAVDATGQFRPLPPGANVSGSKTRSIGTQVVLGETIVLHHIFDGAKQMGADIAALSKNVSDERQLLIILTPKVMPALVAQI